jgi:hypothetical protein
MIRHFSFALGAVVAGAALLVSGAAAVGAAAGGVRAGGVWGTAREIPGTAALNTKGDAVLFGVSCGAAGSCSAGGFYEDSAGFHAFVVSQRHGTWGKAHPVPGLAALDTRDNSELAAVSCAAAGSCSAGGDYSPGVGPVQAFVVSQRHGIWGNARPVPGLAALNKEGAGIVSLSCAAAGDCSAAGFYTDGAGNPQVFVVSQRHGIWGNARPVPGLAALNTGENAQIRSLSCAAPGDCAAGGFYTDGAGHLQAFVVSQQAGIWRRARPVPGLAAGVGAVTRSVSCAAPGDCSAGGFYRGQAFTVAEVDGTWRRAQQVPGLAALAKGGSAVASMSCAAAGDCTAAGSYTDGAGHYQVFVAGERNGSWRTARPVPGLAALNVGGYAQVASVSCSAVGDCSAGGFYTVRAGEGHWQAFVADEVHGTWHQAQLVPGTGALNKGGRANLAALSCAPAGSCSAGGSYLDAAGNRQVFIISKP